MNSKEIAEIKKTFKEDRSSISRICGCYVDGEKNKVTEFKEAFLALPEEDLFKYFSIYKKLIAQKWAYLLGERRKYAFYKY